MHTLSLSWLHNALVCMLTPRWEETCSGEPVHNSWDSLASYGCFVAWTRLVESYVLSGGILESYISQEVWELVHRMGRSNPITPLQRGKICNSPALGFEIQHVSQALISGDIQLIAVIWVLLGGLFSLASRWLRYFAWHPSFVRVLQLSQQGCSVIGREKM